MKPTILPPMKKLAKLSPKEIRFEIEPISCYHIKVIIKLLTKEMEKLKSKLSKYNIKRYQQRYNATKYTKIYLTEKYSEDYVFNTNILDINEFTAVIIKYYGSKI